jgi:hypothetical protein
MVYTSNDKLTATSHVLVDDATKPFQQGLLVELMKKSHLITSMWGKAAVDPEQFLLPNGESAFNYVGREIRKTFDDGITYTGKVIQIVPPDDDESSKALWFRVESSLDYSYWY